MLPHIYGLRRDIWARSTVEERVESLQQLENYLANQEYRQPSVVSAMNLDPDLRGRHGFEENGTESIYLNRNLVQDSEPYQVVETLFHEDRHAHQYHVVNNPKYAAENENVADWEMNLNNGYIAPKELNYATYRFQPVEMDANNSARELTNDLYENVYQDTSRYPHYKAGKEEELAVEKAYGEIQLGENYEAKAREAMISKYQANLDMSEENATEQIVEPEEVNVAEPDLNATPEVKALETPSVEPSDVESLEAEEELGATENLALEEEPQERQDLDDELVKANEMQPDTQNLSEDEPLSEEDQYGYGMGF